MLKLLREDVKRSEDEDPLALFEQGMRTETTRYTYTSVLRKVACEFLEEVLEGTFEERVSQLVKYGRDDPAWTRDLLTSLARKLRGRTRLDHNDPNYLNPTSIPSFFKPVKKLLDMNDVAISWKRIYSTYPELDNMAGSSGWTRGEIATMLKHTRNTQDRALILLLASSGVRSGALSPLNWGDLKPVYRVGDRLTLDPGEEDGELACAMLEVYRGSSESYTAFVTPEAFAAIQEYGREWFNVMGRQAGPKDPMFVTTKVIPKRAAHQTIQKRVREAVVKSGLHDAGKDGKRFRVPLMNGFRRFYNKTCKEAMSGDSTLGSLIKKEYMMGHRGLTSLDENYFKTDVLELAREYVTAVPDLTIDDAERLRLSNRNMAENIRRTEDAKDAKIGQLEENMRRMREEKDANTERLEENMRRMREEKDAKIEQMDEHMRRMEEKMSKIGDRGGGSTADEILNAFLKSPKSGGVPGDVMEAFTGMMEQLGAAQENTIREMKDEYDAKMDRLLRAMDRMAKKGSMGYDPLGELRENDA